MAVTNYYTVEGEIIAEKTAGSTRVDYLTDALGSVTATVNQSAQVVNTYRYKPYGTQLAKTGTGSDPAFGWVGTKGYRPTQKKFSDFYVRARHYGDATGQWTTRDPLYRLRLWFVYASANPTSFIDPSGMIPVIGPPLPGNKDENAGCPKKYNAFLSNCCSTLAQKVKGAEESIFKCMADKGFTDHDPINETFAWLNEACNNPDTTICVYCLPNKEANVGKRPWWYPGLGTNPCHNDNLGTGSISEVGGETLIPIADPRIHPKGTGSTLQGGAPQCPPFLRNKNDSDVRGCNAVIAMCSGNTSSAYCILYLHELIHTGGLLGVPGRHTTPSGGPGDDFIYAMSCCLCGAMYGATSSACKNSRECEKFSTVKSV